MPLAIIHAELTLNRMFVAACDRRNKLRFSEDERVPFVGRLLLISSLG